MKKFIQNINNSQRFMENTFRVTKKALRIIKNEQYHELEEAKRILTRIGKFDLERFLSTNSQIELPYTETPELSIIIVLYNKAELTLSCLYSILRSQVNSYEIVIVDNNSTDETSLLLSRIKGAKIIQNPENLHFLLACNQASRAASGSYLLFLNNDTQVLADSINSSLRTIKTSEDIGAVGGKIILPNGTLQEAGSIIWQDGSCFAYGIGDEPFAPEYMFMRDVDYCSGAFFLTKRELFIDMGGFDEDYKPAYYEETDYCVRLWKTGKRVVYDPNVVLLHIGSASAVSKKDPMLLQIKNRAIFVEKHKDWLESHYPASERNILKASRRQETKKFLNNP
jgi:GT2 family glycosyltransferase